MSRRLTPADRFEAFRRATGGFQHAFENWQAHRRLTAAEAEPVLS